MNKGFSIIEIIVSASIISIAVLSTIGVFQIYLKLSNKNVAQTQAALLVEEAAEGIQTIRDSGWNSTISTYTPDTVYYLSWNGTAYSLSTTPSYIDDSYQREIVFSRIYRDDSSNISDSGTEDENTRKISITVYLKNDTTTPLVYAENLLHNVYD